MSRISIVVLTAGLIAVTTPGLAADAPKHDPRAAFA